jgi:hypothetical protein
MSQSQDRNDSTGQNARSSGETSAGGRSGEGAASAMQQLIQNREQQQAEHEAPGERPQQ